MGNTILILQNVSKVFHPGKENAYTAIDGTSSFAVIGIVILSFLFIFLMGVISKKEIEKVNMDYIKKEL